MSIIFVQSRERSFYAICLLPLPAAVTRPELHRNPAPSPSRVRRSLLRGTVFATIKAVLFDLLLALWRHGNPMLKSRLPMQVTVLNDLAHLQEPCAIGRRWLHFSSLIHATH